MINSHNPKIENKIILKIAKIKTKERQQDTRKLKKNTWEIQFIKNANWEHREKSTNEETQKHYEHKREFRKTYIKEKVIIQQHSKTLKRTKHRKQK